MKITKQENKESALQIKDAPFGEALSRKKDKNTIMRVKPTSFLLNSTLVTEVLNRADVFIVNLSTGTLFSIAGAEEVEVLDASLRIGE